MYEHRKQPLVPRSVFLGRVARSIAFALTIILASLTVGMLGYRLTGNLSWIDAYQEAAMILSGMGPVAEIQNNAGKFFAGTYALYSGLILIISIGVMMAPVAHRFFHKFHLETDEDAEEKSGGGKRKK